MGKPSGPPPSTAKEHIVWVAECLKDLVPPPTEPGQLLTDDDRAELARFAEYLEAVGHGEKPQEAYAKTYGEVLFDAQAPK